MWKIAKIYHLCKDVPQDIDLNVEPWYDWYDCYEYPLQDTVFTTEESNILSLLDNDYFKLPGFISVNIGDKVILQHITLNQKSEYVKTPQRWRRVYKIR